MSGRYTVFIQDRKQELNSLAGSSLLETLSAAGIFPETPCGGQGTCGKCKLRIIKGTFPEPTSAERACLHPYEIAQGTRLACTLYPASDLTVCLPENESKHSILMVGHRPSLNLEPPARKKLFQGYRRDANDSTPCDRLFEQATGISVSNYAFLQALSEAHNRYLSQGTSFTVVFDGDRPITVEAGDTTDILYGFSIDIGTTTVAIALTELKDGSIKGTRGFINPQKRWGLDVLSRITHAQRNGTAELQNTLTGALSKHMEVLCRNSGISPNSIYSITVAANPTMLHLLLGLNPGSMGLAPFAPLFLRSLNIRATDIGLKNFSYAQLYTLPSVSAYIGSDVVAGVHACGLDTIKGISLFVDIGTNGEIVLARDGGLLACSCAAGPALEGMNICCGMRAAAGAIEGGQLFPERQNIQLDVIGNTQPVGISGSGLLSLLCELLRIGLVQKNGTMLKAEDLHPKDPRTFLCHTHDGKAAVRLSPDIYITQKDIRQIQLAKGAILSGIRALLKQSGIEADSVDRVIVAGQFGSHLSPELLTGSGILPHAFAGKIHYAGNTSQSGAYMALLSHHAREDMENLAPQIRCIELASLCGYERLFAQCMAFPSQDI